MTKVIHQEIFNDMKRCLTCTGTFFVTLKSNSTYQELSWDLGMKMSACTDEDEVRIQRMKSVPYIC